MTDVEHEAEFVFTKDNPYLPFTGELWDVFYENLGENLPRYIGTALFMSLYCHGLTSVSA